MEKVRETETKSNINNWNNSFQIKNESLEMKHMRFKLKTLL